MGAFTSEQIVTLGGVAVLVIGAISAAAVAIINALGKMRIDLSAIATKTTVIEGHVNSAATRDAAIIASKDTQLVMLRETVDRLERTAALLATATAAQGTRTGERVKERAAPLGAPKVLKEIEENTAATAENTARTEDKVDALTSDDKSDRAG